MSEDELRKLVENMVRSMLESGSVEIQKGTALRTQGDISRPTNNYFNDQMEGNARYVVAANWKMNMTTIEAKEFAMQIRALGEEISNSKRDAVVCPPIYLAPLLKTAFMGTGIRLGGQNMHHETKGAYTSEISPLMLKDAGCQYVIIGHSERRHIFGEKDHHINMKVRSAFNHGLVPLFCVGETEKERESNATFRVVRKQLKLGLYKTSSKQSGRLIIGYEPVWAIGTGRNATPADAQRVHAFIREVLTEIYDFPTAKNIRILYGGSVTPDNASGLIAKKDIDGFLVGGASLTASKFMSIAEVCK